MATRELVDSEARRIVDECYNETVYIAAGRSRQAEPSPSAVGSVVGHKQGK